MATPRGSRDKGLNATLFDSTVMREAQEATEFLGNVLEASTEYSIIGKDIDGKIVLWNEGARRLYGYEPESDEIRLTEELRASQSYTRSVIASNIDALMSTDPLRISTDINRRMEALTGYNREELIGTPFKNYFTDPQRAEEGIKLVLREDKVTNYELSLRAKDGHDSLVSFNAAIFKDQSGAVRGIFPSAWCLSAIPNTSWMHTAEALERSSAPNGPP
jgi:PAS domain S-box-containing protein